MSNWKPGDVVSHLTLVEKRRAMGHDSKGRVSWVCKCKCGNDVIRREDLLSPDKSMSCGCEHPSKQRKSHLSPLWKGCGEFSGQFYGLIQQGAEGRGIAFDISIERLWEIFLEQGGVCALTGLPLQFYGQRDRRRGFDQTASVDRIDSSLGYVEGNVHWVHKDVNLMKNHFSLDRYLEICRLVTER